jgi:Flp pilus assembly protein TadG
VGPSKWAAKLRRRSEDETGAELIEFAFVAVLLMMLVYGVVFFGMMITAKSTITQAAADGSRTGIVTQSGQEQAAAVQAENDLGWLSVSNVVCGQPSFATSTTYACMGPCTSSISSCTQSCSPAIVCPAAADSSSVALMIVATEATCSSTDTNTCLTTAVSYYDANHPLFPQAPGFNLVSPSTLTSSSSLELNTTT